MNSISKLKLIYDNVRQIDNFPFYSVEQTINNKQYYGLINDSGEIIIPIKYVRLTHFNNSVDGLVISIGISGYAGLFGFHELLYFVNTNKLVDTKNKNIKTGYTRVLNRALFAKDIKKYNINNKSDPIFLALFDIYWNQLTDYTYLSVWSGLDADLIVEDVTITSPHKVLGPNLEIKLQSLYNIDTLNTKDYQNYIVRNSKFSALTDILGNILTDFKYTFIYSVGEILLVRMENQSYFLLDDYSKLIKPKDYFTQIIHTKTRAIIGVYNDRYYKLNSGKGLLPTMELSADDLKTLIQLEEIL